MTSPLAGKVFDETGDRLTPSHTKTSSGKRLRYYVSKRLIRKAGDKPSDGWRLPASELEALITHKIRDHLSDPRWRAALADGYTIASIERAPVTDVAESLEQRSLLDLVQRIDLQQGQLTILLDGTQIANVLDADRASLAPDAHIIRTPFRQRRRGVETKLILDNVSSRRDGTLIRNIGLAHAWFAELRAGASFTEVAERSETSKRRVMQLVDLAFLAPDLTTEILDGRQPAALTSDLLIKRGVPSDWTTQRQLFDSLR